MKNLFVFLASLVIIFAQASTAFASEGEVEMVGVNGNSGRCYASSIETEDYKYNISVTCRNLTYPIANGARDYILWATPVEDDNAVKLGNLNYGRVNFSTDKIFKSLFVTTEANDRPKSPSTNIVMQGDVQAIEFIQDGSTTPLTKTDQKVQKEDISKIEESMKENEKETKTEKRNILRFGSTTTTVLSGLALLGLIAGVFYVVRR